jgi:hypothetical protein
MVRWSTDAADSAAVGDADLNGLKGEVRWEIP